MASDESFMINSSSVLDEEYDDTDYGFPYQTRQSSLSRLSICTSSFHDDDEEEEEDDNCTNNPSGLGNFSLMSFDDVGAEADGEISDEGEESDSDKESSGFYTLPTIISRRRRKLAVSTGSKCNLHKQRREKNKRGNQYGHGFNGMERVSDGNRNGGGEEGKKNPGRIYVSTGSNRETQTSSGGNSPIANWRISSPGDDPKEVKERLKMWAHAVALASASR